MLLQEIFKPEYSELKEIYGISIDSESTDTQYSTPPENFETIGFNLVLDEDNLIDEPLLDIIISYKLTNMSVVIEVPSHLVHEGVISAKSLIQLATNVDFSLSLLPPHHPLVNNKISHEEYIEVIKSFVEEMNKKQNFDKFVAPISNFLEYLMLETLLGKDNEVIKNFSPKDKYIQEVFTQHMSVKESDDFKDVIRESLYDFYGGEENFKAVSGVIFEEIYNKSKEVFTEHVKSYISNQNNSEENQNTNNTDNS